MAGRVYYFTILREPLDRTISVITFMKKFFHELSDEHTASVPHNFTQMSELEILKLWTVDWASAESSPGMLGNPITAMFLERGFEWDFASNRCAGEAAAAAQCIAVLNRFLYVGDFANFEGSVHELARRIRALGASACETGQIPVERVSRNIRGDLGWLEEGAPVVDAYMDGFMIDGMVYRHFAQRSRHRALA